MIEIDESLERIPELCESAPETIEEFELALDLRASAEKLFQQYDCPVIEAVPEEARGVNYKVRELELSDDSSTLPNINITEFSHGRLCVLVTFESDEYTDNADELVAGQMAIFAEINRNNKLVEAATTIRGANYGIHQEDRYRLNRDVDQVSRLAQTLEVLEAEAEAYAGSIDRGIESIHNDILYLNTGAEPRQLDLGVMLPEVALDTY